MKKEDLINQYPGKNFQKTFSEKEKALDAIGTPEEQITTKKQQYNKLFEYDKFVFSLKEELLKYNQEDVDDYISLRIGFHFSQINSFVAWLNDLNFSNPNDINAIFTNFDVQAQAYNNSIIINASGKDITFGKTVIDEYIKEVRDLLKELSTFDFEREKKNIENAIKIAKKLTDNEEKYEKAVQTAESWVQAEGKALSSSLKDKAEVFNLKAQEHKFSGWSGNWIWLVGSILSGIIAVGFIVYFISESGTDLSFGSSLLRISTLFVISYFAFFLLSQFSNNKRLYESYKFKAIALNTMEELVKSYTDDREEILNRAISIIFSEPTLKDADNFQKRLLEDSMDIIKKKL